VDCLRRVTRPEVLRRACGVIRTGPVLPGDTRAQAGHDVALDVIRDFWWACLSAPDLTPVPALPTPPDSFPIAPAAIRHTSVRWAIPKPPSWSPAARDEDLWQFGTPFGVPQGVPPAARTGVAPHLLNSITLPTIAMAPFLTTSAPVRA